MKLRLYKNSILFKFVLAVFLVMLIPFLLLLTFTQKHIENTEQESARQYLSASLTTVSGSIDGILENVEKFYIPLLADNDFKHSVKRLSPYDTREPYQDFTDMNRIRDTLLQTAVTNNYIYSIYAYCSQADRTFSSKVTWDPDFNHYRETDSGWLSAYEENAPGSNWILTSALEDERPILTSYRTIKEQQTLYCLLSINIDAADISDQLANVTPDESSYCFMTDSEFHIIGSSENSNAEFPVYQTVLDALPSQDSPDFFTINVETEKMFVFSFLSKETNFRYFIVSPSGNINILSHRITSLLKWYFLWILMLLTASLTLAFIIFFRPIKRLIESMKAVQSGNFDVRLPEGNSYEISYINEHFNAMTENLQILIRDNYEHQLSRKDAEMHNILNQLNEHFLYNTLDSIRWMARMENAAQTSSMVYSLAKFYRINLSSGEALIPAEQLVEMLTSYLTIQEIRMKNLFTYSLKCDEQLYGYKILKYLFQPIIENSLVHGLNGLDRPLAIEILFEISDDSFHFCVTDNGTGISPQMIQQIYKSLSDDSACSLQHFALKMIHRQLFMEYGLKDALRIHSEQNKFCKVEFYIPLEKLGRNGL